MTTFSQARKRLPTIRLRGRRILLQTPYRLPKDKPESERLDLQHGILFDALGQQVFAPIEKPRQILDVACGTGLWGREVAEQHKKAKVLGLDYDCNPLRIAQANLPPGERWPRNFRYQEANALERLPFAQPRFDYTHARMMAPFIPGPQWPAVLRELARVTVPGGWIECVETTLATSSSPSYQRLTQAVIQLNEVRHLLMDAGPALKGWLEGIGLEDIQSREQIISGEFRPRLIQNMVMAYTSLRYILLQGDFFSEAELAALLEAMPKEMAQTEVGWKVSMAWGRKPR